MTMIEIVISCSLFLPIALTMLTVSVEYILEIYDILREPPNGNL